MDTTDNAEEGNNAMEEDRNNEVEDRSEPDEDDSSSGSSSDDSSDNRSEVHAVIDGRQLMASMLVAMLGGGLNQAVASAAAAGSATNRDSRTQQQRTDDDSESSDNDGDGGDGDDGSNRLSQILQQQGLSLDEGILLGSFRVDSDGTDGTVQDARTFGTTLDQPNLSAQQRRPPLDEMRQAAAAAGAARRLRQQRGPPSMASCMMGGSGSAGEACEHTTRVYDRPAAVPIQVCAACESMVAPKTAQSVTASAMPLPHSMRRDERWSRLLKLHDDHARSLESIERMQREQERALLKLHEWRDLFTGGAVDYSAQNNPIYAEIERSIKKMVNLTAGFQQTIVAMLDEHRTRLIQEMRRAVPQTQAEFVNSTKRAILRAKPNAMLYPTAGEPCSVCDKPVNVRLHQAVQRTERKRSSALPWASARTEKVQPCTCHTFSTCVDCLLAWYWEKTEGLQKSFATCPACRAEFVLEDIVPVFSAKKTAATTNKTTTD